MKAKKFIAAGILAASLLGLQSCNKAKEAVNAAKEAANEASGKEKVDYKLFSDPAQTKKWYDAVVEKLGENAKITDEVRFLVTKNSDKVVKTDDLDELMVNIVYQDNEDKRRVQGISYSSNSGWKAPEVMEIDVIGGNPEDFRLEDELFDFKEVTAETIQKVVDDAWKKYKDDEKFEYQYVYTIVIKKNLIDVSVKGKLKSNGQEKFGYYKTDFKGNPVK